MPQETSFWSVFMYWFVILNVLITAIFTIVVIIGGIADLKYLFTELKKAEIDITDDGRVVDKHSVNEKESKETN